MNTILFDTETTGLLKPSPAGIESQPYIIEIYCMKAGHDEDGNLVTVDGYHSKIKPPTPLPAVITKITGITEDDLRGAPSFVEVWKDIARFFTGAERLVAHNLSFDRSMLANELIRVDKLLNFPWPIEHICTVEKSLYIQQRRMSLTKLHKHFFGKEFVGAHRAEDDVNALFACYKEMIERDLI